jgi:hypothetical protein
MGKNKRVRVLNHLLVSRDEKQLIRYLETVKAQAYQIDSSFGNAIQIFLDGWANAKNKQLESLIGMSIMLTEQCYLLYKATYLKDLFEENPSLLGVFESTENKPKNPVPKFDSFNFGPPKTNLVN